MLTRFPRGSSGSSLFRYWCKSSFGGFAHRLVEDRQSLQRPAAFAAHTAPSGTEQIPSLQFAFPSLASRAHYWTTVGMPSDPAGPAASRMGTSLHFFLLALADHPLEGPAECMLTS